MFECEQQHSEPISAGRAACASSGGTDPSVTAGTGLVQGVGALCTLTRSCAVPKHLEWVRGFFLLEMLCGSGAVVALPGVPCATGRRLG